MKTRLVVLLCLVSAPAISHAQNTTVRAKALGPAPGTIVCRSLSTVQAMFELYAERWEEGAQAVVTHGASTVINGDPLSAPALAQYGCALAKPGTKMEARNTPMQGVVFVSFKLPNGKTFSGVTQENMIALAPTDNPIVGH